MRALFRKRFLSWTSCETTRNTEIKIISDDDEIRERVLIFDIYRHCFARVFSSHAFPSYTAHAHTRKSNTTGIFGARAGSLSESSYKTKGPGTTSPSVLSYVEYALPVERRNERDVKFTTLCVRQTLPIYLYSLLCIRTYSVTTL